MSPIGEITSKECGTPRRGGAESIDATKVEGKGQSTSSWTSGRREVFGHDDLRMSYVGARYDERDHGSGTKLCVSRDVDQSEIDKGEVIEKFQKK